MREARDKHEQKAIDDVRQHGLHIVHVLAEGELPEFSYTVGLYHTFEHPEVLLYGLPREGAHRILNDLADNLRTGQRYIAGETYSDLLKGYRCTFRTIPVGQYLHLGWAVWFNEGPEFPAVQLVYPDRDGRWPWQDGVTDDFRRHQVVLADAPIEHH